MKKRNTLFPRPSLAFPLLLLGACGLFLLAMPDLAPLHVLPGLDSVAWILHEQWLRSCERMQAGEKRPDGSGRGCGAGA